MAPGSVKPRGARGGGAVAEERHGSLPRSSPWRRSGSAPASPSRTFAVRLKGDAWADNESALQAVVKELRKRGVGPGCTLSFLACGNPNVERGFTLVDLAGLFLGVRVLVLPTPWAMELAELRARGKPLGVEVRLAPPVIHTEPPDCPCTCHKGVAA